MAALKATSALSVPPTTRRLSSRALNPPSSRTEEKHENRTKLMCNINNTTMLMCLLLAERHGGWEAAVRPKI